MRASVIIVCFNNHRIPITPLINFYDGFLRKEIMATNERRWQQEEIEREKKFKSGFIRLSNFVELNWTYLLDKLFDFYLCYLRWWKVCPESSRYKGIQKKTEPNSHL